MHFVGCASHAGRESQGLDIAFGVLGHLINDDGAICGIVLEAAKGRELELEDRPMVYAFLSKLQQHGFVLWCPYDGGLSVVDGKVKAVRLWMLEHFSQSERDLLEEDAERHWEGVERLFLDLELYEQLKMVPYFLETRQVVITVPPVVGPDKPFAVLAPTWEAYKRGNLTGVLEESSEEPIEEIRKRLASVSHRVFPTYPRKSWGFPTVPLVHYQGTRRVLFFNSVEEASGCLTQSKCGIPPSSREQPTRDRSTRTPYQQHSKRRQKIPVLPPETWIEDPSRFEDVTHGGQTDR
ncbi:hypothetical protein CC1G_15274 [Coprinopsis cinerea okayama7|uniref:Uncharacterized protein n=1 Tax=Coprinopsis cinerea (strain Okayama-7 / 130 / ATCC MYA-4618 / FGSC 9003) TaxID=240176 RepID=D6RQ50_COPC7|nr:hypothetical protein CC1G_15274 [Coprinopsis cinerea okayama7\|eukprot:XP_002910366.1 hypothetical protein CC1G_15274 [Coprinopsis cinerea okayama7\